MIRERTASLGCFWPSLLLVKEIEDRVAAI